MRLAFASPVPLDPSRPPPRERATSLVLAVGVTLLILIGFLTLNGTAQKRPQFKGGPVVLDLKDDADRADATRKASPKPAPARPRPATVQPPVPPPPVPLPPPLPVPEDMSTHYIHLTPQENDAADISRHPRVAMSNGSTSNAGAQQALASGAGDSQPIGNAPNGQPLYRAEWYRRPTNAELNYYLPPHVPVRGIGVVACRTVANHHVDDCVELGSSPPGSHLAGAVRQAAWQFLVRPPRRGGRELVGAWVSIEIDYNMKPAEQPDTRDDAPTSGD